MSSSTAKVGDPGGGKYMKNTQSKKSKALLLAAALGMALLPFTVYADTDGVDPAVPAGTDPAAPRAEAATASDQLPAVLVTATKRATTVQSTPISITAVTSEDIASRGITDF